MKIQKIEENNYEIKQREGAYLVRSFLSTRAPDIIDEEKRTVELSFSSEKEVSRYFGIEILGHESDEVQIEWLSSGRAPLLFEHSWEKQIGVVESATIDTERKGRAVIRFGKSEFATEVFNDVIDGIRTSISVGYFINAMILEESKEDMPDKYRVIDWEPFEISIVSVPADREIGIGRSFEYSGRQHQPPLINIYTRKNGKNIMSNGNLNKNTNESTSKESNDTNINFDRNIELEKIRKEEAKRAETIRNMAKNFNLSEMAEQSVKEGETVEQFHIRLLEYLSENEPKIVRTVKESDSLLGLSQKDARRFSILNAVRSVIDPKFSGAGFENEVMKATRQKFETLGKSFRGQIAIPMDVMISSGSYSKRDLSASGATSGLELVGTDHMGESFIDALRGRLLTSELGARMMTGLIGNVTIPKLASGGTAYWIVEGADVTESTQTTGAVNLSPKTVGTYTDITRRLLAQSSPDAEQLVRDDLTKVIARGIDTAAYNGSGSSGQPTGIINVTGIGAVDYGAGITFGDIVDLETAVDVDNALMGNLSYVTTPTLAGSMKQTLKSSGVSGYIWEKDEINGYPAYRTTLIPSNEILFGNWEDLIIGSWGVLDLNVDTASLSTSGGIRLVALQDIDIAVRHPESFARGYT